MSLLRPRGERKRTKFRSYITIQCPYNGHQVSFCRGFCEPVEAATSRFSARITATRSPSAAVFASPLKSTATAAALRRTPWSVATRRRSRVTKPSPSSTDPTTDPRSMLDARCWVTLVQDSVSDSRIWGERRTHLGRGPWISQCSKAFQSLERLIRSIRVLDSHFRQWRDLHLERPKTSR